MHALSARRPNGLPTITVETDWPRQGSHIRGNRRHRIMIRSTDPREGMYEIITRGEIYTVRHNPHRNLSRLLGIPPEMFVFCDVEPDFR